MSIGKLIRNKRGQSIIEFALVLPVLLMIMFGVIEFGRAIMTSNVLHQASREGARVAAVLADPANSPLVTARVNEILGPANITATPTVTYDAAARTVRVDLTSDFTVIGGGIVGTVGFPLTASTTMRHEL